MKLPGNKIRQKRYLGNLVNYILNDGKKRLMITSDDLAEIKAVKKELEKFFPGFQFVIEDYGVDLGITPRLGATYKRFEKISGYSLWRY